MEVDFSQGGYQGDVIEEVFKPFSRERMPFWWHFREVLRASQSVSSYWLQAGTNTPLSDEDQRQLIALSLLHYYVYLAIFEAYTFISELEQTVIKENVSQAQRLFDSRRYWKAAYSSLYTSFNALCNIVYVLLTGEPVTIQNKWGDAQNYSPGKVIKYCKGKGIHTLAGPLEDCEERLELRHHLSHYWTIWIAVAPNQFAMDKNFEKGYLPIRPNEEVKEWIDARGRAINDLVMMANSYNVIYQESSVKGGFLDRYLASKNWTIDYSDYGAPHNGQRPIP